MAAVPCDSAAVASDYTLEMRPLSHQLSCLKTKLTVGTCRVTPSWVFSLWISARETRLCDTHEQMCQRKVHSTSSRLCRLMAGSFGLITMLAITAFHLRRTMSAVAECRGHTVAEPEDPNLEFRIYVRNHTYLARCSHRRLSVCGNQKKASHDRQTCAHSRSKWVHPFPTFSFFSSFLHAHAVQTGSTALLEK